MSYSGEVSGSVAVDKKSFLLKSQDGIIKVSGVVRVTKGSTAYRMNWANDCPNVKTSNFVYKIDKGSFNSIDCLVTTRVVNIATFVQRFNGLEPSIKSNPPQSASAYYVQFTKTMDSGGFFSARFLIAGDMAIDASKTSASPDIPASVIDWALKMADGGRDAIGSFSGNWSLIAPSFQ